jgi:hypothetical protein
MDMLSDGKKSNKILFIGKNSTHGNSHYFASGLINAFITFKNLKNSDGYKRDSTTLYFSTYPIRDNLDGNNDAPEKAVDLEPFFDNTKSISFAGVLDHKIAASKYNMEDYYKISLRMNDTLKILAKSSDTLTIDVTEPGKNSVNKIYGLNPKKEAEFNLVIGSGHLDINVDPANKSVDFYVRIYDSNANGLPNPYVLSISRLR